MSASRLSPAEADFELALLNAEAESISSSDLYAWLRESGLPSEVAIRLKNLTSFTIDVAGHIINIGKIILIKIFEFVKANPNLAVGISIGGALAALVNMVPFIGPLLVPIAIAVGVAGGAIAGHRLDETAKGKALKAGNELLAIGQDIIEIAKSFFQLLIEILNTILAGKTLRTA